MKQLLVLGAGLVSPPLIRYFLPRRDVRVAVASLDFSRIEPLVARHSDQIRLVPADINDETAVRRLMRESDAVVSLLPAPLLPAISRMAVEERRHLVSTSYTTDAVRALDAEARAAGVLLLNEIGFDPGIDHMTAMRLIERIQRSAGVVTAFRSAAAGLPAPEADTNPWRYKFSWNPHGVLTAARASARYLRDGNVVEVRAAELLQHTFIDEVEGIGRLEIYPNRDSLAYRDSYGLHSARNLFRGTMRWPGWMETIDAAARLGWLDTNAREWPPGTTYRDVSSTHPLAAAVEERLRWAGFFSDEPIGRDTAAPLDIFVARLEQVLRYEPGERDMAVLQHRFEVSYGDGRQETIVSGVTAFGEPHGDTAMSRLVGLPAAIAANLILEGGVRLEGVCIPTLREVYEPVLDALAEEGIEADER